MSLGHSHSAHSNIIATWGKVDIVVQINANLTTQSLMERSLYISLSIHLPVSVSINALCVYFRPDKNPSVCKSAPIAL